MVFFFFFFLVFKEQLFFLISSLFRECMNPYPNTHFVVLRISRLHINFQDPRDLTPCYLPLFATGGEMRDAEMCLVLPTYFYWCPGTQATLTQSMYKRREYLAWADWTMSLLSELSSVSSLLGGVLSGMSAVELPAPSAFYRTSLFIFVNSWEQQHGIPWSPW